MSRRLLPLFCALAIAGCGTVARQTTAPVTTPFTGTWHQAGSNAHEPAGFLAIDGGRVLFNLAGLPRGAVSISDNGTDPGLRSGRLVCDDGRVLFLAVGDSLTTRETAEGRLLAVTLHLDVQVFAPGSAADDQPQRVLRLWPSAALALAALPTPVRTGAVATSTPTVAPSPASPEDQRFHDAMARLDDPFLASLAVQLAGERSAGRAVDGLDLLYRRALRVVHGEVLRDLEAARRGDHDALVRADGRMADVTESGRAYAAWRDRR